jgi:peptidoglycan/LPS O-acetylase OafA/YrhL
LSGFVIASVHAESDQTTAAARTFLIRRFFRLYPLHLATLAAAVLLDWHDGTASRVGYGAMVFLNLGMAHAWGMVPGTVLNGPSWSISTEWGAYLLFAWLCLMTRNTERRIQLLAAVGTVSLVSLLVWRDGSLDGDLQFRLARCLMSFALGAATWAWCRGKPATKRAGVVQVVSAAALLWVVAISGDYPRAALAVPVLSAAIIAGMACDAGSNIKRALERPVLQWLGRCSYSIYLVHMPLFRALVIATPAGLRSGPVSSNLWCLAALALLLVVCGITQALIEKPWRAIGRRIAEMRFQVAPAIAS